MAAHAAKLSSIYDPSRALSGRSLQQAASALTDLQTKPAISQLAKQIAASQRQARAATALVGGYYQDFGRQTQQALTAQQTIGDETNQALAGIDRDTQARIGQAGQAQQQQLAGLVDRGLDGGAYARLASTIAQQQTNAAQNAQVFRSFGATQGGNWRGLTAGEQATGAARGQDALRELNNAFAQAQLAPGQKIADLQASRGDLMAKNVGALRDSERNYQATLSTLGIKQASVDNQAAALKEKAHEFDIAQALKDKQFQLNVDKFGLAKATSIYQKAHGLGPFKGAAPARPLTQSEMNYDFGQIDAAKRAIGYLRSIKTTDGKELTTKQIRQAIAAGGIGKAKLPKIANPLFVDAAMDLVLNGLLSRTNVHRLHLAGLKIGGRYKYQLPVGG